MMQSRSHQDCDNDAVFTRVRPWIAYIRPLMGALNNIHSFYHLNVFHTLGGPAENLMLCTRIPCVKDLESDSISRVGSCTADARLTFSL